MRRAGREPARRALASDMRIKIDDPAALPDLLEELASRVDAVITEVTPTGEVELWLLGSRTAASDRAEMERRLENRTAARDAHVWILPD
jgi:hypothetical protein